MKIGLVFTNYNNSHYTRKAIHSLALNKDWNDCDVVIVDNNSAENEKKLLEDINKEYPTVHLIFNHENQGYFNGLNIGIQYLRKKANINFIVVGNNDLIFPDTFINSIYFNEDKFKSFPVISPDIMTIDGVHQNPHVINKVSKFREIIYTLYYSNYFLAVVIMKISEITKHISDRKDEEQYEVGQTIYQGYGACYILGPLFFKHFNDLWAPTFLMGEEFFLSKQLSDKKLQIYYEPSITVHHSCHATMGNIPNKKKWEIAREAHEIYRKYVKIW